MTPRPIAALKRLVKQAGVAVTHQPTSANAHNLADGFVAAMQASYGASALGRQELEGLLIDDPPGALWRRDQVEACGMDEKIPKLGRIIVAVDPPVTAGATSDECGIIIAGREADNPDRAVVLADMSFGPARPADWAQRVAEGFALHQADAVIAEANQGGDMVRSVLRTADPGLPVKLVRASRGKHVRAEPVAALYSAGRVRHAGRFPALEDQMCAFGAPDGPRTSPDRVDALVWAITDLLLGSRAEPRIRRF